MEYRKSDKVVIIEKGELKIGTFFKHLFADYCLARTSEKNFHLTSTKNLTRDNSIFNDFKESRIEKIMEFKVGDKVDWLGIKGEVVEDTGAKLCPLKCHFDNSFVHHFTRDGKFMPAHTEVSLKLVAGLGRKNNGTF